MTNLVVCNFLIMCAYPGEKVGCVQFFGFLDGEVVWGPILPRSNLPRFGLRQRNCTQLLFLLADVIVVLSYGCLKGVFKLSDIVK